MKKARQLSPAGPRRDRPQAGPAAHGASLPFDRVGDREIVENFPLPPDVVRVRRRRHQKLTRGHRNVAGPSNSRAMARLGARQASRLEPRRNQLQGGCIYLHSQSFLVQNFALSRGLLEAFNPGIRGGNERSRDLSCPRARASKIKTILELEADRRRNHPDGSRGISVSRPGSSIVRNGGIGGRSPRHLASPLGISRIRCRP
jgi:hypothetical protein